MEHASVNGKVQENDPFFAALLGCALRSPTAHF
jgi:hypothetical protein